jgi:hypothetical protein
MQALTFRFFARCLRLRGRGIRGPVQSKPLRRKGCRARLSGASLCSKPLESREFHGVATFKRDVWTVWHAVRGLNGTRLRVVESQPWTARKDGAHPGRRSIACYPCTIYRRFSVGEIASFTPTYPIQSSASARRHGAKNGTSQESLLRKALENRPMPPL